MYYDFGFINYQLGKAIPFVEICTFYEPTVQILFVCIISYLIYIYYKLEYFLGYVVLFHYHNIGYILLFRL